ncbi:MAG TPA: 16S rRNA (cytosine(1402)-N(4))-methyltransferase RsmH [Phycisphaerae bacterium]
MAETPGGHIPVLPGQVLGLLAPAPGAVVLDVTIGLAGHAVLLAEAIGPTGLLIGLDVDESNLAQARARLARVPPRVELRRLNYAELGAVLPELAPQGVDVILADLGVSSTQLEDPARGFSFSRDGPLDMRMDRRLSTTAADLVNRLREEELADLIYGYGQEHFSRRIARRICEGRRNQRITTTARLAELVSEALGVDPRSRRSKIHPATRTFQALRIAVNNELADLETLLAKAPDCLRTGGRIGVISFHSLEDRRVKRDFLDRRQRGIYEILTKRPVVAEPEERAANPRARSAKFRAAQRLAAASSEEPTEVVR